MAGKPKNHGKKWTATQEKQLTQMAKQDKPTTTIASKLGRTQVAIASKANELGLSLKSPN